MLDGRGVGDAGVVDQHVDRAERVEGRRDRGIPLRLIRHIEVHEPRAVAELGRERRTRLVEEVGDDDAGTGGVQRPDIRLAEPAGAARDQRDASVELDHTPTSTTTRPTVAPDARAVSASGARSNGTT